MNCVMNARNELGIDWIRMEMLGCAKNERNMSNLNMVMLGVLASIINFKFPSMWCTKARCAMTAIECLMYMSEIYQTVDLRVGPTGRFIKLLTFESGLRVDL